MKIYLSPSHDPYFNLSLEEILLRDQTQSDDIVLFYQNQNTIVIGRNQNAFLEINRAFTTQHAIKIARRISGGGAVYHDLGNLNFSFITNDLSTTSYQKFLQPIIAFLATLNCKAVFKGRNDLLVNQQKISGNAQYKEQTRMFHHGTLLYDANLTILGQALQTRTLKVEAKGIKSNLQRVANIKSFLTTPLSTAVFRTKLIAFFEAQGAVPLTITATHLKAAQQLAQKRQTWTWIYGRSLQYAHQSEKKLPGGILSVALNTKNGCIIALKFSGDFLSQKDVTVVAKAFEGVKLQSAAILATLAPFPLNDYFGAISATEITNLILGWND